MKTERKFPAAIQALLDVMDSERAKVAAHVAGSGRADGADESDVNQARTIAEIAADLIPKAPKATEAQKRLAKAIAKCNSMALALGDFAAKRAPQPASIAGYKLLAHSKASRADLIIEALGELATERGDSLSHELERSSCKVGKSGGFTKTDTKGATPAAKSWRALTGAACAAGILTSDQVLRFGEALNNSKKSQKAA